MLRTIKFLETVVDRLDQLNLKPLQIVSAKKKRYLVQQIFGFFTPSLARVPILLNGFPYYIPLNSIRSYVTGKYEATTVKFISSYLKPGMVAVDVGAYIGYYTILMAQIVEQKGKVYTVEPAIDNREYLSRNIKLNHLSNVQVIPFAAGSHSEIRDFHIGQTSTINSFYTSSEKPGAKIEVIALDDLIKSPIDFIKIDVEGAEIDVLKGMHNILTDNQTIKLIIEWHLRIQRQAGYSLEELPQLLMDSGLVIAIDGYPNQFFTMQQFMEFIKTNPTFMELERVNLLAERRL